MDFDLFRGRLKCVEKCPEGTWQRYFQADANLNFTICEPCPLGCKRCDLGHFHHVPRYAENTQDMIAPNDHVLYESCNTQGKFQNDSD